MADVKDVVLSIPDVGGFMGNQLYFVLQAFANSVRGIHCRYLINDCGRQCHFADTARILGMEEYVVESADKSVSLVSDYYQLYGRDFSSSQLNAFIENTIMRSEFFMSLRAKYSEIESADDVLCLNIRNGDYLRHPAKRDFAAFDRLDYFKRCFEEVDASRFQRLDVLSDDNRLNERLYDQLFRSWFGEVRYLERTSPCEDMLRLAFYRNRIIMNSTFSYWGSFIGECLHPDSMTVAPNYFTHHSLSADRCAPNWRIVDVKVDISAVIRVFGFRIIEAFKSLCGDFASGRNIKWTCKP